MTPADAQSTDPSEPDVSFIVPAFDEEAYLRGTLSSVQSLDTALAYEVLVVDGGSSDDTPAIAREYDATLLEQRGSGIAAARNLGAANAAGEWLAFVDADTELRANYLTAMVGLAESEGLAAASSYCRIAGPWRANAVELTINHVLSRLEPPILPGFNCFVHRDAFEEVGGVPDGANAASAFSRELARVGPTGFCRQVLVETSGRRVADRGLTGTLARSLE